MIYAIGFDFAAEQREAPAEEWLQANLAPCARILPRLWIGEAPLAAEQIRNGLAPLLGEDDQVVIVKLATEAVWHGLGREAASFLAAEFPGSVTERIAGVTEGLIEG